MERLDPAGMQRPGIRSIHLSLQVATPRAGRPRSPHQRDLPDARSVWLPARPCSSAPGGLGGQFEEGPSDLQRIGPATAQQDAQEKSEGEAAQRSSRSFHIQRDLGLDFVHDRLATGQKIRVLTVVDTFSRFSPVIDPRFSYRAEDVLATLEGACASMRYPIQIFRLRRVSTTCR